MDPGAAIPIGPTQPHPVDDLAAAEIRAAVVAGELRPWYQPIVELRTGRIVGAEALARWHSPDGAVRTPDTFLPVAERSGLVLDVDRAIFVQALTDLARWQQIRPDFRVSVNLSGRHLDRPELPSQLTTAVTAAGVASASVDLEITETARPTDLTTSRDVVARLGERGHTVWLDDFGTGWSSLQDLITLPVGGIKLDRTFAGHLGTRVGAAVIGALTTAADQVGFKVTIEGLEHRHQVEQARALGCHYGQGYWWARPCSATAVTAMLTE